MAPKQTPGIDFTSGVLLLSLAIVWGGSFFFRGQIPVPEAERLDSDPLHIKQCIESNPILQRASCVKERETCVVHWTVKEFHGLNFNQNLMGEVDNVLERSMVKVVRG